MTCIYSTLKFVQLQAKDLHVVTLTITFDQPLWVKAIEIVKAKSMDRFIMLGRFHLLMSFLESIVRGMKGSRLEDALEQIYGKSTVPRALPGHFRFGSALVSR